MLTTERARPSTRWLLVIAALAVLAFLAAIAVQRNVFPFYSGDHDEPVYRFQAAMLRMGEINIPLTQNEFFRPWLSGPGDGHLVMAFSPGWPSVLMAADVATGSMLVALGVAAALTVVAAFGFARELLGSTRRAVLATAIVTLSPFTLMLSGTYLNYVFALALYLIFGALLMRGLRCESPSPLLLALSGLVLGAAFITRPYDAVLFAIPFAVYIVATRRHDLRQVAKIAGWVALGVAPAFAVTLAYNLATTGSLVQFPVSVQSGGFSQFGWGTRSIAPDTPPLNFTIAEAFQSMGTNLWAIPTWIFGTYLTCGLAIFGTLKLWRTNRAICGLLLGLIAVFPIGYLAWWASSLTTSGALTGLGPHYYLPMLVPLAILAAQGLGELAAQRRSVLIGALVIGVVLTGIALPPKINEKHTVEDASRTYSRQVTDGLRQRNGDPALVIQERRRSSYIMEPYPFLANPPDLKASILYARDRGARDIDLLDRHPERRAYRLVRQVRPGGNIEQVPVVVKPQSVTARSCAPGAHHDHQPRGPAHGHRVRAVRQDRATPAARHPRHQERALRGDVDGRAPRAHLQRAAGSPDPRVEAEALRRAWSAHRRRHVRQVGGGEGPGRSRAAVLRARSPRATDTRVELLTADEEWTRFGAPIHAWLPIAVDASLQVRITKS